MSTSGSLWNVRLRTYLVLVEAVVVAEDIAMTIADFDPAARVLRAATMAAAEAALRDVVTVEVAFVAGPPAAFLGSPLHGDIVARQGRVVLLGVEAEATGSTPVFDVLCQPFDTDALLSTLDSRNGSGG